jgi:hypothetical protein
MFREAAQRIAQAAGTIGIRGVVVHAISAEARAFYIALGFDPCPAESMALVVTLRDLQAGIEAGWASSTDTPQARSRTS